MADTALIPEWSQAVGTMLIGLVAAVIGIMRYVKTQITKDTVVAPTDIVCIENRSLKDLTISIRDHEDLLARKLQALIRSTEELKYSMDNNTESFTKLIHIMGEILKSLENKHE